MDDSGGASGAGGNPYGGSAPESGAERGRGYAAMVAVYLVWGLLPAYWKLLAKSPPLGVMAHRALWAGVFVFGAIILSGKSKAFFSSLKDRRTAGLVALASLSLAAQWAAYLLAISSGKLVELSLGYFIYPLVVALLGRLFLGEKLGGTKSISLVLAALGVLVSLLSLGRLPALALALAASFAVYSLVKKKIGIPSLHSTGLELLFLSPFSLGYCAWSAGSGMGFFLGGRSGSPMLTALLLLGGGALTALTLALFAAGSSRIPIFAIGLLQYISPTMVLALGVFVYGEAFGVWRALSFGLVWAGIAVYAGPGLARALRSRAGKA
ncbi:MAG TPA: EamA family transporter RarD [Rectinemataceae bacterium]